MERQFTKEIESLRLGDGETFHGEGILAVTKALLQSGVSYVGGYQGAPVSHLLDVMVQAKDYLDELLRGVQGARTAMVALENSTDEELAQFQEEFDRLHARLNKPGKAA